MVIASIHRGSTGAHRLARFLTARFDIDLPVMNHDLDRWLCEELGSPVHSSERLVGGLSSKVTRYRLDDGRSVVVREITDTSWFENEPDLLDREAAVLFALWNTDVRVPELLAIDNDRGILVMSFVDGVMRTETDEIRACAEPLAELIAEAHQLAVPPGLPAWRPWGPASPEVPDWAIDRQLWRRFVSAAAEAPGAAHEVLLHRDLHPLNVLWREARGVAPESPALIDWVNACRGHPHADLAHCRWNLAVLGGPACADRFLDRYLLVTDSGPYDPAWDLIEIRGLLPGPIGVDAWHSVGRLDVTPSVVVERTEAFLATALEAAV